MRMAEARNAIGEAVTSAITANFEHAVDRIRDSGYVPGSPVFGIGPNAAGRDASRAPEVPEPLLAIRYDDDPGVIFTWKSESGHPPYVILHVPKHWRRDIVHPGWVVLDGHPVLRIDERDPDGRPVRVLAVMVTGHYDGGMHGWRATGFAVPRSVEWEPDGASRIVRDDNDPLW